MYALRNQEHWREPLFREREIKVECFGSKGVSGESVRVLLVGVIAPIYQVISFFTQ